MKFQKANCLTKRKVSTAITFCLWARSHCFSNIFCSGLQTFYDCIIRFKKFESRNLLTVHFSCFRKHNFRSFARMFPRPNDQWPLLLYFKLRLGWLLESYAKFPAYTCYVALCCFLVKCSIKDTIVVNTGPIIPFNIC